MQMVKLILRANQLNLVWTICQIMQILNDWSPVSIAIKVRSQRKCSWFWSGWHLWVCKRALRHLNANRLNVLTQSANCVIKNAKQQKKNNNENVIGIYLSLLAVEMSNSDKWWCVYVARSNELWFGVWFLFFFALSLSLSLSHFSISSRRQRIGCCARHVVIVFSIMMIVCAGFLWFLVVAYNANLEFIYRTKWLCCVCCAARNKSGRY